MSVATDVGDRATCLAFGDDDVVARWSDCPRTSTGTSQGQCDRSRKCATEVNLHLWHASNHPANCGSEASGIGIGESAFDGSLGGEKVDAEVAIVVERVSIGQLIHGVRTQVGQRNHRRCQGFFLHRTQYRNCLIAECQVLIKNLLVRPVFAGFNEQIHHAFGGKIDGLGRSRRRIDRFFVVRAHVGDEVAYRPSDAATGS